MWWALKWSVPTPKKHIFKQFSNFSGSSKFSVTSPYVFLTFIACCCAENKFYSCWFKFISYFVQEIQPNSFGAIQSKLKISWCFGIWRIFFLSSFPRLSFKLITLVQVTLYNVHSSTKDNIYCTLSTMWNRFKNCGKPYSINVTKWRKGSNRL